jgi:hypothetical protein
LISVELFGCLAEAAEFGYGEEDPPLSEFTGDV